MQKTSTKDSKSSQRVIKKYPNRRLYDTDTSTYITLAEIKQLVMDSEPFSVVDAKTGDDLTRSILLQIILEEEANGSPMFTTPVLSNIIRFYGHAMQGMMGGYLEKTCRRSWKCRHLWCKASWVTICSSKCRNRCKNKPNNFSAHLA